MESEKVRLARYEEISRNMLTSVTTPREEESNLKGGKGKHAPIDLRQLSLATPGNQASSDSMLEEGSDDSDDEGLYVENNKVGQTTGGGGNENENERNGLTKEGPY